MLNWYRAHMAAHPARCRLAIWHHPRWVSGNARVTEDRQVSELYNGSGRWVSEFDGVDGRVRDRTGASC
jgi:hypothetical protein